MKYLGSIILLVFVSYGGILFAQDYNSYYDAEDIIREKCESRYSDDYQMQAYCIKKQRESVQTLEEGCPDDILYDVFQGIRSKCGARYPDDYQMRAYCEKKQCESWRELQQ